MFRIGQIVKLNKNLKGIRWYTSDFIRITNYIDSELYQIDTKLQDNYTVHIDHIYDATEEYRQETIKRLLCSE